MFVEPAKNVKDASAFLFAMQAEAMEMGAECNFLPPLWRIMCPHDHLRGPGPCATHGQTRFALCWLLMGPL
jgi:hypothetical protein